MPFINGSNLHRNHGKLPFFCAVNSPLEYTLFVILAELYNGVVCIDEWAVTPKGPY